MYNVYMYMYTTVVYICMYRTCIYILEVLTTLYYNLQCINFLSTIYLVLAKIINRLFHEKSTKQPYRSQGKSLRNKMFRTGLHLEFQVDTYYGLNPTH